MNSHNFSQTWASARFALTDLGQLEGPVPGGVEGRNMFQLGSYARSIPFQLRRLVAVRARQVRLHAHFR
jgi:hypothetical protein